MFLDKGQPGANLFRSNVVAILVLIFAVIFFSYISHAEKRIYEIAVERTVNDINASLALTLYSYIVQGKISDLPALDGENPFNFLAKYKQLPINYKGPISHRGEALTMNNWYYDLITRRVLFRAESSLRQFSLKFEYKDKNRNQEFDKNVDQVTSLKIEKKNR